MSNSKSAELKLAALPSSDKPESKWSELFSSAKTAPFCATNMVFEKGALVAYEGSEKKAELSLKQINGVFFAPSDDENLDLFVFYPETPGVKVYTPKYMGTLSRESSQLESAETLFSNLGIKYTLPSL